MKFIFLLILPLILFSYGFPNIMDADGAIACSLTHLNEYIMKSASPKICERVNYWVHYECGRVPGMYLTDARCQPPAGFPLERLATSGSFMEISLDKSIYKMGNTIQVSGNAYTSVGLPEKNLGIKIIDSDGRKIFEGKNTVDKAGHFGFNILTGTSNSITQEGNYELVIVNYGKFGSTGVKKFTASNDGLPIQIPTTQQSLTATPSSPTTQDSMGSISSHTSPNSPIILHTEKKEYGLGESITLNGIVKFVNDKAVGVGLPRDLNIAIEVYDSKNSFIESHVLKAKNDDTFTLTLDTGDNSKITKIDQYYFVAYYGMVNSQLLNSDFVGRYSVYIGETALTTSSGNVNTNDPVNIVKTPNIDPTNVVTKPLVDWPTIAVFAIMGIGIMVIIIMKLGVFSNKTIKKSKSTPMKIPSIPNPIAKKSELDIIIKEIKSYKPPREKLKLEYNYQLGLHGYLSKTFPQAKIEKSKGSSRPDIIIDNFAIEIKGPTRSSDLSTIADKILRYKLHWKKIIIVLFEIEVKDRRYNEWKEGILRIPQIADDIEIIEK
jgi:hypothetical protein